MTEPVPIARPEVAPSEQDARTRSRLLRAGVEVFDKKGYDAASVREIVELAGVTKPALYYHFGSKDGLLKAILVEGAREFEAAVEAAAARAGSVRERIIGVCEQVHGLFQQNLSFVRVTHAVFLGPTDIAPDFDFSVYEAAIVRGLTAIIADGQARGEVTPGDSGDVALVVLGVISAVAGRQLHARLEPIGTGGLRRLLTLVFDGVLRDSANANAAGEQRQ
jgi:TetR/AcrR family transcriptional regulator